MWGRSAADPDPPRVGTDATGTVGRGPPPVETPSANGARPSLRWSHALRRLGLLVAFVMATVAAALVGSEALARSGGLGANPSAAMAVFGCLHLPRARWGRILAISGLTIGLTRFVWTGDVWSAAGATIGATAFAATLTILLVRYGSGRRIQRSIGGAMWFNAALATGALVGAAFEHGMASPQWTFGDFANIALGHALGLATTLPFMLAWRRPPQLRLARRDRQFEAMGLGLLWGAFVVVVATGIADRHPENLLLLVPAFSWTAARFGLAWATLGNLLFVLFVHDTGLVQATSFNWALSQRFLVLLSILASYALSVLLSDRDRALTSLARSEARLRAVLGSVPELVLHVDEAGDVLARLGSGAGFPLPRDMGRSTGLGAFFGKAQPLVQRAIRDVLQDGQSRGLEARISADGGDRWIEVRISPLSTGSDQGGPARTKPVGRPVFSRLPSLSEQDRSAILSARDVTDERQGAEQQAEMEKSRALRQLTGGVAHDFNNLLTTIIGNLDLIRADLRDMDQLDSLDDVARAAHRGRELTHRLLAYSERQPLQPKVVDLAEALPSMVERLAARLNDRDIRIDGIDGALDWRVSIDIDRLGHAIASLVDNAVEATSERRQGSVGIRLERRVDDESGSHRVLAALIVEDNGEGMTIETLGRACDPFFTTRGMGHTGLGLSMVRGFARQSGGRIELKSSVQDGTSVELLLPLFEPPALVGVSSSLADPARTVVAADRDPDVRRIVGRHAMRRGFHVAEAASASELRGLLMRLGSPALIVVEQDLGDWGNHELQALLDQHSTLIITEQPTELEQVTTVLRKPFAPGELLEAMSRLLPRRSGQGPSSVITSGTSLIRKLHQQGPDESPLS